MKELWYTFGPSSDGKEKELFLSGATGVRLTFSYGTPAIQDDRAIVAREAATQVGRPCFIIADLAGEKFRLGTFTGQSTIEVAAGTSIRLVNADSSSPSSDDVVLPIPRASFFSYLKKGSRITIGDGAAVLIATRVSADEALAEMITDGTINNHRGLTIQSGEFRPRCLTTKDLNDLDHILSSPLYDAVALSFTGAAIDISTVRELAQKANRNVPVIAKIETLAGLENIDAICRTSDFVMAARGDLALAQPWIELPEAMQRIVSTAKATSTPWILATQVVEGLERYTLPTRSEICDLAHWLKEGCSGVLLSYETAFGSRPVDAIACTASMLARWE